MPTKDLLVKEASGPAGRPTWQSRSAPGKHCVADCPCLPVFLTVHSLPLSLYVERGICLDPPLPVQMAILTAQNDDPALPPTPTW